ncbi:MAG: hypothetical protein HC875_36015 [Anaerolineales bacterium]|nr:hypothetical protein [Anaerolineales bacterium]
MFKIRVLTPAYLLTGEVEENNAFLGWLNNKDKNTLDLHNVEGIMLDPNASMPATAAKLVTLAKSQVVALDMMDARAQRTINVSNRTQQAVLYTSRFIIQANLHPTGDMPISNIPNVVKSDFVPLSKVKLHPLLPTRKLPSLESPLMIFNWRHVDFYHELPAR